MNGAIASDDQVAQWEALYGKVCDVLDQFGAEDSHIDGDFWVHDNYWGHPQIKVYVHNLNLLRNHVIMELQSLLANSSDWEIIVAVAIRGPAAAWPDMGLTIRANEMVDALQRSYFPYEFQDLTYPGSRSA